MCVVRVVMHPSALLAVFLLLCSSGTSRAEVSISTDKPSYQVGEIVQFTAHNAGPEDAWFISSPFYVIWNEDTGECLAGCLGLPVVEPFPVDATIFMSRDTGVHSDPPGTYRAELAMIDGPSTTYTLIAGVSNERSSWSTLKSQYR